MPGLLSIVLGPKEGKQGVTTMEAAGYGEGEIAQEGGASGLRENGTDGSLSAEVSSRPPRVRSSIIPEVRRAGRHPGVTVRGLRVTRVAQTVLT